MGYVKNQKDDKGARRKAAHSKVSRTGGSATEAHQGQTRKTIRVSSLSTEKNPRKYGKKERQRQKPSPEPCPTIIIPSKQDRKSRLSTADTRSKEKDPCEGSGCSSVRAKNLFSDVALIKRGQTHLVPDRLLARSTSVTTISDTHRSSSIPNVLDCEAGYRRERAEHERTKQLLRQKTEELRSANTFLDQVDTRSCVEVAEIAENLNDAILQIAATIADSDSVDVTANQLPKTPTETKIFSDSRTSLEDRIGPALVSALDTMWPCNDPFTCATWIQYALQSYLVTFCSNFLLRSRWGQDQDTEDMLSNIYQHICDKNNGPHAIAGRWRALTHKACHEEERRYPTPYADYLLGVIIEILVGIGAWKSRQDIKCFMRRFREPARHLVSRLFQLDIVINEEVITSDILPLVGVSDGDFNPYKMVDEDADDRRGAPIRRIKKNAVLAPVALGLDMRLPRDNQISSEIILKSKVILKSILIQD